MVGAAHTRRCIGTAFIFADIFDEYAYHSESPPQLQSSDSQDVAEEGDNAAFEIPLNTLIECLNIFGTAGGAPSASGSGASGKYKKWKRAGDDSDQDRHNDDGDGGRDKGWRPGSGGASGGIEQYFSGGSEKRTGMRMSYAGAGYPLTLLM